MLAQVTDESLGWTISYRMDRGEVRSAFIEEQKYMILAAVAMLVIIVQASVLIAHNISDPIRRLSEVCRASAVTPAGETWRRNTATRGTRWASWPGPSKR